MAPPIIRKILNLGGRHVHVRICGEGAPVIILHQSPRSSREMEPLLQQWGKQFCCIAPDHPGYGYSDPLAIEKPTLDDFADATAELIDHLGLEKITIYGHHTGAKIALALGVSHPQKVQFMVLNGLLINTQADRDAFARDYLPPFTPSHDASHLMTLWWRMREQSLFFPWYNRTPEGRMVFGIGAPENIHEACRDFLSAGDNYRKGYGAALAANCKAYLERLTAKTLVTAWRGDPLWVDVGRIEPNDTIAVERADTADELGEVCLGHVSANLVDAYLSADKLSQSGSRTMDNGLALTAFGEDAADVLAVADAGSEIACESDLLSTIGNTLGLDPSGHGASSASALDALPALPKSINTIVTLGLGIAHLPKLAQAYPNAKIICADLILPETGVENYLEMAIPDLKPVPSGAQLNEAFLACRSAMVFWPWFETGPNAAVPGEHLLETEPLHVRTRALLRGWQAGQAALKNVPEALDWLSDTDHDVTILLPDWAEIRTDVRKKYGKTSISYYAFANRSTAIAQKVRHVD